MKLKASFLSALLLLLTTAPTSDGRSRKKRDLIDLLGESLFLSDSELKCLVCHWGADALVSYAHKGWDPTDFLSVATTLCHWLKIEDKVVCRGVVGSIGKELFHIIRESKGAATSHDICGMVLEGECAKMSRRMSDWRLEIPDLDRPDVKPTVLAPTVEPRKKQKVLQISDVHLQRDYKIGSNAICHEPVCCLGEEWKSATGNAFRSASFFGDYNCDIPPWSFDAIARDIRRRHPDVDFVLLTGDFPPHDIWEQSREKNLESSKVVADVMSKHFGDLPVYVNVGNHESFPVNMFPGEGEEGKYNPSWLYAGMADFFKRWLPGEREQRDMRKGGYFHTLIRPGLRLVSINTNFCNNLNFWLLLNFDDPSEHLHWLYAVLLKAERRGEAVYIIGHIPPGIEDCFNQWSHEYNRLIRRFRGTVRGQFFGHTHKDEYEVFFDGDEPVSTAYLGPSISMWHGVNPAYRIYEIDGEHENTTNAVLDFQTYYYDLEATVRTRVLTHVSEYSAKRDLGMSNLNPEDWRQLALRMVRNDTLFHQWRFYFFHGGPSFYDRPCGSACKHEMLCHLLSSDSGNRAHCAQLTEEQERVDREKEAQRSFLRLQQEEEEEPEEEEEEDSWWSSLFRR